MKRTDDLISSDPNSTCWLMPMFTEFEKEHFKTDSSHNSRLLFLDSATRICKYLIIITEKTLLNISFIR